MSSPTIDDAMAGMAIEPDPQTRSTLFCSSDADITFTSSDEVLFNIHRKNLETSTGGFPPAGFSSSDSDGEPVPLNEDSETLELLFQFVYPRPHPALSSSKTSFPLLAKLSEAAEKYQVFAAVNICNIRMEQALAMHPVEVLNYAAKHGYPDLIEAAVPLLLDMPMETVVQALSENLVVPWVIFRQQWSGAILKFVWAPLDGTNFVTNDKKKSCKFGCIHGGGLIGDMWPILGEKRSLDAVISAYASLRPPCAHIAIDTAEIRARLGAELSAIPAFSP